MVRASLDVKARWHSPESTFFQITIVLHRRKVEVLTLTCEKHVLIDEVFNTFPFSCMCIPKVTLKRCVEGSVGGSESHYCSRRCECTFEVKLKTHREPVQVE